jgi:two-component system LytT family sensor kinase
VFGYSSSFVVPRMVQSKSNKLVQRTWLIWAWTFGIYTALAVVLAVQDYYLARSEGSHPAFLQLLVRGTVDFWIYALLTPPVLWLCWNYPIRRKRLYSRLLLHFAASLLFTALHVSLRIVTYPVHMEGKVVPVSAALWRSLFLYFAFDNIVNLYAMIAIFAHMMLSYRDLRERELRSAQLEGKLAKAQLSMLKMQLQPHFLFNTLNAVSALTRDHPEAAEDMLVRLSDLLRRTLDNDAEQEVPLRAELEFLGQYLEIEQVRFADRLKVDLNPDPETLDALVPNMFLQPLVENALRHGIGQKAQGGRLEMRSWREASDLLVSVQDSGPGFSSDVSTPIEEGIGLSNTRSRLQHLHPGNHQIKFTNAPGGGAVVTLRIPFRTVVSTVTPADEAIDI